MNTLDSSEHFLVSGNMDGHSSSLVISSIEASMFRSATNETLTGNKGYVLYIHVLYLKQSLSIFMHHLADVIGIAFGLNELREVGGQRVVLMDLLQTLLVEQLGGKKGRAQLSWILDGE